MSNLSTTLALFFAGMLITNGVPHFIKGITGEKHQTPFGKHSSAVTNVWWGGLNFLIGTALLRTVINDPIDFWNATVAVALGSILIALVLAHHWSKD